MKGFLLPNSVSVSDETKTTAKQEGNKLAQKAVMEGTVLLKNEGNVLPLSKSATSKINLLGYQSVAWLHGGSGSGMVRKNPDEDSMADLASSLRDYGITLNEDILSFYQNLHAPQENPNINTLDFNRDDSPHFFDLYDPAIDFASPGEYEKLLQDSLSFSDTAIVVIGRQGGESEDMPEVQYKTNEVVDETRHHLEISAEEKTLLSFAGANYSKVIVVINSTNLFQMDFLDAIPGLGAALYIGPTGSQGASAIAKILYGEEGGPSGHLADILPYDFTQNPSYEYCGYQGVSFYSDTAEYGKNQRTNAGVSVRPSLPYVDYVEGIYLGYRYYETADAMGKFSSFSRTDYRGETKTGYDAVVQFPFGFGLSYTDFSWTFAESSLPKGSSLSKGDEIEFKILVENKGQQDGEEVVQLYLDAPYQNGGIEKSATKLVDFAKTSLLAPGESEMVSLRCTLRDLASYDCYDKNGNGQKTYELDPGEYRFSFRTDSHHDKEMEDNAIAYRVKEQIILDEDPNTGAKISNLFTGEDAIDGVSLDGLDNPDWNIPYISRSDLPSAPIAQNSTHDKSTGRSMGDKVKSLVTFGGIGGSGKSKWNAWIEKDVDEFGEPLSDDSFRWSSSSNGYRVMDSDGKTLTEVGRTLAKDYDDPLWDEVLRQISCASATALVDKAHPNTKGIDEIGYPNTVSLDGPAQIGCFNAASTYTGVGFPCASVLAQSWNKDLLFEIGLEMGNQMTLHGVYGVYGCCANLHRNPFGGRNYEYYSEDPFLTGFLASNYAYGVKLMGNLPVIKHFVAAETETSRDSLYTWMSEQTLRELYLESFRLVFAGEGLCNGASHYGEEAGYSPRANAIMTAYNRIGAVWCGGSAALMKGVLRKEWGFHGEVITDYADNPQYMHLDQAMSAGGSLGMHASLRFGYDNGDSFRARMALRDTVKGTVYANLNAKYALEKYQQEPYAGKKASSAQISKAFDWVSPLVVGIDIFLALSGACIIYFLALGHPGIKRKARKESTESDTADKS